MFWELSWRSNSRALSQSQLMFGGRETGVVLGMAETVVDVDQLMPRLGRRVLEGIRQREMVGEWAMPEIQVEVLDRRTHADTVRICVLRVAADVVEIAPIR